MWLFEGAGGAAGAVALEVEGGEFVAGGFDAVDDAFAKVGVSEPFDTFGVEFDAAEVAVVARAELMEPECAEDFFGAFYFSEIV